MPTLTDRINKAREDTAWREEQLQIANSPEEAERQRSVNQEWEKMIEERQRSQIGGEQKG